MDRLRVSVIIETITTRFEYGDGSFSDDLGRTLASLGRQTYPHSLIEPIVVIDHHVAEADGAALRQRYPSVKFVSSAASNYFAAKNAGAEAAGGDVIALLDGDCDPAPDWLEMLLSRLDPGVAAVAGRTRYTGGSWVARTFSIPDFAYVLADEAGAATGFNINNLAIRRAVLLEHPFDTRISRNGGCYFLFHQLRAAGKRVVYEPRATVAHGIDIPGLGFVRKHFDRGYDGVTVYRLDSEGVLRGTPVFRRLGAVGLIAIIGRRIVVDWTRLLRHHRQIGVSAMALPYFWAVAATTRLIELTGGLTAIASTPAPRNP